MKTFEISIGGVVRHLPVVEVAPGVAVALFNMLGDTQIVECCAQELALLIPQDTDVLVTPEVKAVPLAHALSRITGKPYVVARKTQKPYMVAPVSCTVNSITTGKPQLLVIDGNDVPLIKSKKVVILDDVVSTGSTLEGLSALIQDIGGHVHAVATVFTEGKPRGDIIALGHLPLFEA